MTLLIYTSQGKPATNVDSSLENTNAIQLVWPGGASSAQTIAGMIMEFRYCQFGLMATEGGSDVSIDDPKIRVISFGAQLDPNFLLPSNFNYGTQETSTLEKAQFNGRKRPKSLTGKIQKDSLQESKW